VIDINDNDFKLLKMYESLLTRVSTTDGDIYYQALNNYKNLSEKIEKNNYDSVIEKINNYMSNKHNLSLEEELNLLEELENDYRQLEELQYKLKKIVSNLNLSDLSNINLDVILDRKNLISGYLINLKNIEDVHKQLEKYNKELIIANKQKEAIERKYQILEEELKRNFINAEGRILTKNNINFKNTSIKEEYHDINIDLMDILTNSDKLLEILNEINNLKIEKDELLKTGEICYENIPTQENKEILDSLRKDAISINYQLSLIKIVNLINDNKNNFDKMIEKREKIKDLIKRRNEYLEKQNIKYAIDPFSRIKLDEQIKQILELGDNTKDINKIKQDINELDQKLTSLNQKNVVFLTGLDMNFEIIIDTTSINDIDISDVEIVESPLSEITEDEVIKPTKIYDDNQIVNITAVAPNFKIGRVMEKASSVIKRVNEIFNNNKNKKDNVEITMEKSPELIISQNKENELIDDSSITFSNVDINEEYFDELEETPIPITEEKELFDEDDVSLAFNDTERENIDESSIFENNQNNPFNGLELFSSKLEEDFYLNDELEELPNLSADDKLKEVYQEDTITEEEVVKEDESDEMPEAFWETLSEETKIEETEPTFDEQIKKLKLTA